MSSLLQRLQAKLDEYRKDNPDYELTAEDEAEIMQRLAEERLPKNTAIIVEDTPSQEDAGGTVSAAENPDATQTSGDQRPWAKTDEDSQQQADSVSKDSKVDSAKEGDVSGQQAERDETPAHKSMPDQGKDDGEQQRSDIPAEDQDTILADSTVRPGVPSSTLQNASDEQQVDVEAEPKVADDNTSTETNDLDKLKGLEVSSDGTIYDNTGNAVARLAEGEADELVGWAVGDYGEILDDDGDLIGRVELIKQDQAADVGEKATQDSVDESKGMVDQTQGEKNEGTDKATDVGEKAVQDSTEESRGTVDQTKGEEAGDTDQGKNEAGNVAIDVDDHTDQKPSGDSDEPPKQGGEDQPAEDPGANDESQQVQESSDAQVGDDKSIEETTSGDHPQTKEDSNESQQAQDKSDAQLRDDQDIEETGRGDPQINEGGGESQEAQEKSDAQFGEDKGTEETASGKLQTEGDDNKAGEDGGNNQALNPVAEQDASAEQTTAKDAGDMSQSNTDAESAQLGTVDKDASGQPQAHATEEQSPRKGIPGRKAPRKLQSKSRQSASRNERIEKADSEARETRESGSTDHVDNDTDAAGQTAENVGEENVDMSEDAPEQSEQQDSEEAKSTEQAKDDETFQDMEKEEQSASNHANKDGSSDPQADHQSEPPANGKPSEDSNKPSGDDGNAVREAPERQDSGVEDVSEPKEKQDQVIADSQDIRPEPEEDQEGAAGEHAKQNEASQEQKQFGTHETQDNAAKGDDPSKASQEDRDGGPQATEAETAEEKTSERSGEQGGKAGSWDEAHGALDTHNTARQDKGSAALKWDDDLARDAAAFAEKLSKSRKLQHSGVEEHGETVFVSTGDASYNDAVQSWLAEEGDYDGGRFGDGNASKYARFTQCVWHNSSHFGIAKATSKHGGTFIVARYWPQGNIVGEKPY